MDERHEASSSLVYIALQVLLTLSEVDCVLTRRIESLTPGL